MMINQGGKSIEFNELEAIQGMVNGDISSFNVLYNHYNRTVHANILKLIRCPHSSAEILQDVFVALWQNRHKVSTEESVGGWLFVVSYNKSLNTLKNNLKGSISYLEELNKEFVDETETTDFEVQYQVQLKVLDEAVNYLPARKKEVFKLCRFEGRSKEEVALAMGISLQSVNDYLKQANQAIRKYILNRYPEQIAKYVLIILSCAFLK